MSAAKDKKNTSLYIIPRTFLVCGTWWRLDETLIRVVIDPIWVSVDLNWFHLATAGVFPLLRFFF